MPEYPAYRHIGKSTQRLDAVDIVTGKATFLDDFKLPNMLIGRALRSPHAHARIKSIDAQAARALKGVHAVLTHKEVSDKVRLGWPLYRPFMGEKVCYVGDIVALIAAETDEIAEEAIDLIEVEYEVLKPVFTALESLAPGAPQLYDTVPGNDVPPGFPQFQPEGPFYNIHRGDIEEGFAKSAFVAEDTIHFNKMCPPLSPEPPGSIVRWDGGDDYRVWATTQSSFILKILNSGSIPGSNLRVSSFNVGGSYGNKQALVIPTASAAMLSRAAGGRPVKFFLSKVGQLATHETRLGSTIQAKIGVDKDGRVCAVQGNWLLDSGAFSDSIQGQVGVGLGEAQLVTSKCKYWDFDTRIALTNKAPAGIVRGYGGQELNSCLALLIARAMKAGNFDPIECYKLNYVQPGDKYQWRDGLWWECKGSLAYPEAMEAAAQKFGWKDKWKGWGVPTSVNGRKVTGVGAGIIGNGDVGEDYTEAYVKIVPNIADDGSKVVVQIDVTESGMGQRSNLAKMAAEILDVDMSMVQVTDPDTLMNPTNMGLCGSRGTITNGRAVSDAALDLKRKVLEMASAKLKLPVEELDTREGYVYVKADPEKRLPWKFLGPPFLTIMGYGRHIENFSTPNFCIFIVEVEVDLDNGLAKILKIVSGTDAGQIIDAKTIEMQMHGGIGAACVDTALYEEHIVDKATGRLMTTNLIDYKWRPFNEFPAFDMAILESQINSFHFKAVGVGEISGAAGAGAVLMAISNAIGEEVSEYPATPDVVLKAIAKKSAAVAAAKKGGC